MAQAKFYNSLTKKVEPFSPAHGNTVYIYNCGPTVYKRQHIGNMRRYLFSDFLRRSLEFIGYKVVDVTNITDVGHLTQDEIDAGEDKLEKEAKILHRTPQDIASEQTVLFFKDMDTLNIKQSSFYPRASQHIKEMQEIIGILLERGHAYQTKSGIYYDVQSFQQYGKLSGNTLENIEAGARVEVREEKKHPADFALWKTNDPNHLQQWESPWGRGYPGWHIECSAMSMKYLNGPIDIHTGGIDNKFPHHENEIAQSEGTLRQAQGKPQKFVNVWMHNAHLQFKGSKLAKRQGQQITLDTIQEKGYSPLAFRLFVFGSHYRSKIDFSWDALAAAQQNLETIKQLLRQLRTLPLRPPAGGGDSEGVQQFSNVIPPTGGTPPEAVAIQQFESVLADDLNTPKALAVFMSYIRDSNTTLTKSPSQKDKATIHATLRKMDDVLGIISPLSQELESVTVPDEMQKLVQKREEARHVKEFKRADSLRKEIEKKGFTVEDTDTGPRVIKRN